MREIRQEELKWLNEPAEWNFNDGCVRLVTDPGTDFWQRTYYGFRNDNAPVCYFEQEENFSFTVKTAFNSSRLFDQSGIIIYQDSDTWSKGSIEYESPENSKLGSVVTNLGYSDWASTDIDASSGEMWYRLSRRGQDFLIENSPDGTLFHQMRIFHFHKTVGVARIGVYACSPMDSRFTAIFSHLTISECLWKKHEL